MTRSRAPSAPGGGRNWEQAIAQPPNKEGMEVEGGKVVQTNDQLAIDMPLGPQTAHKSGTDSWLQLGFLLATCTNSVFVLGYSGTIMVPLGWAGGVIGLVGAAAISFYANAILARLHELGEKRHIRYRDLAGYIYGWKGYMITWVLQYVNLFMINSGLLILGGSALKAVYVLFRDDHEMKLPYFIIMAGFICALFAISTPNLSSLRVWLGVSTICSLFFISVAVALSIKDGIKAQPRDYSIQGRGVNSIFTIIGATANLVFAFNTGMLPEIQATVKQPMVENMLKALYFQFSVGVAPMFALTFLGYWAYGNSTSAYLLNNVNGPVWIKTVANIFAFLQSVISLHVFASPTYEYLDTKFGVKGSALALKNMCFRVVGRGGYLAFNTLVSALLPFLGDFISLTGALSILPLAFILANHMYLIAKKNELGLIQKLWHWLNVVFFTLMSVAATVAALRLIAVDSQAYSLFADV